MPSKAQAKTSDLRNQTKSSLPNNVSKASANSTGVESRSTQGSSPKPLDTPNAQKPTKEAVSTAESVDHLNGSELQDTVNEGTGGIGVNRKKQKRRQKEAARKAAERPLIRGSRLDHGFADVPDSAYQDIVKDMATAQMQNEPNGYEYREAEYDKTQHYRHEDEEAVYYGNDMNRQYENPYNPSMNGHSVHDYISQDALGGKAKKKKKAKADSTLQDAYSMDNPSLATRKSYPDPPPPPPPPLSEHLSSGAHRPSHNDSKDRIWNTSTAEERERIKDFWLSLGEDDRRSLVKVEKEAVLKKMKEQQKHSCSCAVCGRKRTAIEEELEVLYDAYYEELEVPSGNTSPRIHNSRQSRGRIHEIGDDDEAVDGEYYSDEADDGEMSDEELDEHNMQQLSNGETDFLNFGRSLTVQGGILTVADDLLKNDGKKFIEMMEQLAERRMQREEDQYARAGIGHPPLSSHSHDQPAEDDGYDDEEEDEEYDEDDEEFDEEDEMESMTEMDRMREGRRMFQIFAARMFEQRVLTAYREKVALERQKKLLEELDDESRVDAEREAKKAKEAQKRKDKKRQQKEAKDAEKAKREAEKAAEEAAAKALEEKKAEEVRQRKDEQRRKREAEKKSQDEERQRKEVEKQRRLQEAKDQQVELERKQRAQREREKQKREEMKKREREEKESKERAVKEKKERYAAEQKDREARVKVDNETKERDKHGTQLPLKKKSPVNAPSTSSPLGLHPPKVASSHTSPRLQIATPVVPKAPTPARPRQPSLHNNHNISPKTSQITSSSTTTSPTVISGPPNTLEGKATMHPIAAQTPQTSAGYSPASASPGQPMHPPGLPNIQVMSGNHHPSNFGPPLSPATQQTPYNPAVYPNSVPASSSPFRNFAIPNGMPCSPGISASTQVPPGRGAMMGPLLPHISTRGFQGTNANDVSRYGMSRDNISTKAHSRNTSASYDRSGFDTPTMPAQTQPIARPAPIKRPSSVAPYQHDEDYRARDTDVDDLSNHLGSSALLDDTDVPLTNSMDDSRYGSMAPGATRIVGSGFGSNSGFQNPLGVMRMDNFAHGNQAGNGSTWSAQHSPFGAPSTSGPLQWPSTPGFGRTTANSGFGSIPGSSRLAASRDVTARLLVRTACENLTARSAMSPNIGWHRVTDVLNEVHSMKPGHEAPAHELEMLEVCRIEGNSQNGGGTFLSRAEEHMGLLIRFDPGRNTSLSGRVAGDLSSPIIGGSATSVMTGSRPFQQPGGF